MAKGKTAPNVVVVGAGITGAFTAYFMARLGVGATLAERREPHAVPSAKILPLHVLRH